MTDIPLPGVIPKDASIRSFEETYEMVTGILRAGQMMPRNLRTRPYSIPLTVISGFLGAGKTTLLAHALAQSHGRRIAILVNDFGKLNIDVELIGSRTDDTISLTNGCVCCSISSELTRTLIALIQRPEPPDAVVLEASGLADPRGIIHVALGNPTLRLDGVMTIVDAQTLLELSSDPRSGDLFQAQLSAADVIILNKTDLLTAAEHSRAHAWFSSQLPSRPVINAVHGDVPMDIIFGGRHSEGLSWPVPAFDHAGLFESWSFRSTQVLDRQRFDSMIAVLPTGIMRAKGILWLSSDRDHRTVYQRVGTRQTFLQERLWEYEQPQSLLVLLGYKGEVDEALLRQRFDECRAW